jgi:hypothetical protein
MPHAVAAIIAAVALALGPAVSLGRAGGAARSAVLVMTIEGWGGKIGGWGGRACKYDSQYDVWNCTKTVRIGATVTLRASVRKPTWYLWAWGGKCERTARAAGGSTRGATGSHTPEPSCTLTISEARTEVKATFLPRGHSSP